MRHDHVQPAATSTRESTETRSYAFDHLDAHAVVIDGDGTIVDTNESWRLFASLNDGAPEYTGITTNYLEVCDRAAADGSADAAAVALGLRALLAGERDHFDHEYASPSPTQDRWFLLRASSAPVAEGNGAVLLHLDITPQRLLKERLSTHADLDELTGLPSRRASLRILEQQLSEARATGANLWVLRVDVAGHGTVVEDHGASNADRVLVEVGARAQRVVRDTDLLCRWAEDQFLLACPGLSESEAASIAERIADAVARPIQLGTASVSAEVHVGLAPSGPGSTVASLVRDASARPGGDEELAAPAMPVSTPLDRRLLRSPDQPSSQPLPKAPPAEAPTRVQEALDRAEAIFRHSSDLVMFFRADGTIEWVSAAAQDFMGVDPEDLVGQNGLEMIHPDDWDRVFADFASVQHLGDEVRTEFRVLRADGELRWIEEIVTNLLDEPTIGAIVGNLRDVTDRKAAEEAVHFQARLLASAGQAMVAVDADLVVTYWNDAAEGIFGWSADDAVGQHLSALLRNTKGWESMADHILVQIQDGRPWSGRTSVPTADGRTIPVHLTCTALFDDDGTHVATIGVCSDLTEQVRSERAAAQLSAIIESSNDAIYAAGRDGLVTTWNTGARDLYGYEEHEIIGHHVSELVPGEYAAQLDELHQQVRRGGPATNVDLPGRRVDGGLVHLSLSVSPIRDSNGRLIGVSTSARDVTERVELEQRIEDDRRKLNDAQASARLGSYEFDLTTGTGHRSDELLRILGVDERTFGPELHSTHPEDRERVHDFLTRTDDPDGECIHRIVRPDGEIRWVLTRTGRLGESRPGLVTGTMLDITERYEAELALAHQATHDPLTGLLNRTSLVEELRQRLQGSPGDVAVAFVDLDQFKRINDSLGHTVGDRVLQTVADRLTAGLRDGDVVGRFGGDEFVLARFGVSSLLEARRLADDAALTLIEPVRIGGRSFELTASIGVTMSNSADSAESLLRDADSAMYQAKSDGRARTAVFDATARARAHRRVTLQTALQQALEQGELRLAYQPIVDLPTERIAGFESLLRWEHPTLGPIGPDEFIPIAESSGLILPIGDWVVEQAMTQLASWRADPRVADDLWVAVNLSTPQLGHPGLVDRVVRVLQQTKVPAELLHLEITESVLMDRVEHAMTTLGALRALGTRVSIDDFGTGYSSLSYLNRLSIDTVKIDRSFIQDLGTEGYDSSIVRAITALASSLGLQVVAEGIEIQDQLTLLRDLGCEYGQGYLWSKPLFPEDAFNWMVQPREGQPAG